MLVKSPLSHDRAVLKWVCRVKQNASLQRLGCIKRLLCSWSDGV